MKATRLEVEGVTYVVYQRDAADGSTEFSFDGGETFFPRVLPAYLSARESNKLILDKGDVEDEGNEAEAWILSLVQEVSSLKPGERLVVTRDERAIMVLREVQVSAIRAGALRELEIKTEAQGDDPDRG